jgi:voltage-gated potassium channel
VYFSFITMLTVGYGDITPASHLTRALAWVEAMDGQIYIVVLVCSLVNLAFAERLARQTPDSTSD